MPNRSRNPRQVSNSRKTKKTFLLSREAVDFLEDEKHKHRRKSTSVVLEEIIRDRRRRTHSKSVDAAISAYYDSISDEERIENKHWGAFAESQFPVD